MPLTTRPGKIWTGTVGLELLPRIVDADDAFTRDDDDDDARAVDLTGASALIIRAEKPDGTVVDWTATGGSLMFPERTAIRGWMRYLTQADDLDQAGTWKLQPRVTIGAGDWPGDILEILVHQTL